MPNYTARVLSGSTDGKVIAISQIVTPGTVIHTALGGTAGFDEVYAWVSNVTGSSVTVTVEWGGVGTANQMCLSVTLGANSPPTPLITGQRIQNGAVVAMFASVANAVNVTGYCNRIS